MNIPRRWPRYVFVIVVCLVALTGFIFAASITFRTGFPLDDAWIHQTFARNLVQYKEWSFNPGYPTSGSTSPLWTLLLAPAFILKISPVAWAYVLGGLFLCLTVILIKAVIELFTPINGMFIFMVVLSAIALEWHLIWAAASGMETILFSLLLTLIFYLTARNKLNPFLIGLVIGLSIWVRPEGITTLGPVFLVVYYLNRKNWKNLLYNAVLIIAGLFILVVPYLLFNFLLSGSIWPNTLLAKQIEYQSLLKANVLLRFIRLFATPMVGSNLLVFPGFIYAIYLAIRKNTIHIISFSIWLLGFILVYSLNLPVTYQHGRYLIPTIPIYLCLSIPCVIRLFEKIQQYRFGMIFHRVWSLSLILVSAGFWFLGAKAYANDVAVIETEMVEPAKWISEMTPVDSQIAAHDIGALGFFGNRYVIDLAGLVNKAVGPIVTDTIGLQKYLKDKNAGYLMTFPNWYSNPLVPESRSIYIGKYDFSKQMGGERMEIYNLK